MKKLVVPICFVLCLVGCLKSRSLEDYAIVQVQKSIEPFLEQSFPGKLDWRIEDIKTIYYNDSICLLQCTARLRDSLNQKVVRDYRYMYKIEMDFSRAAGHPVFYEDFENVLCLTDKQIRFFKKKVKRDRADIYKFYSIVGRPVRNL